MPEFLASLAHHVSQFLGSPQGIAIAIMVLAGVSLEIASSIARTMVPLRALKVGSNLFLMVAAVLVEHPVNVLLFAILLPLNADRLVEIIKLSRRVTRASEQGDLTGYWLKPYMRSWRLLAGTVLFSKGDTADSFFLLVEGDLELVEIGKK